MKNEKAVVLVGREKINGVNIENYQLLIRQEFTTIQYHSGDSYYREFLDEVSREFAEKILDEDSNLEVGVLNGFKINENTDVVRIGRLEDVRLFETILSNNVSQLSIGRAAVMSAAEMN